MRRRRADVGLPVFGIFQGGDFQLSRFERYLRPHSLKACAGLIIGPSREAERVASVIGVSTERIARIVNPVDVAQWRPVTRSEAREALGIPQAATVVVWHGRIDLHPKGLDVLTEAWRTLCRDRPGRDLRLLLIGTGSDAERFRKLLMEPGLPGIRSVDETSATGERCNVTSQLGMWLWSRHDTRGCRLRPSRPWPAACRSLRAMLRESATSLPEARNPADSLYPQGILAHSRAHSDGSWTTQTFAALSALAPGGGQERFSLRGVGEQMLAFLSRRGVRWPRDPAPAS